MPDHHAGDITMRTTIDLESDVLAASKDIARQQQTSVGTVISRLVRQSLIGAPPPTRPQPGIHIQSPVSSPSQHVM